MKKELGIDFVIPNSKEIDTRIIIDVKSTEKLYSLISKRVKEDDKYFDEYAKGCLARCRKLLDLSTKISKKNVNVLKDNEIKLLYEDYTNSILELIPFLNSFVLLTDILAKLIKLELKGKGLGEVNLEEVVVPSKINNVAKEIGSMLEIASRIERNNELKTTILKQNDEQINKKIEKDGEIESLVDDHVKKYGWITSLAYVDEYMSKEDVKSKIVVKNKKAS
jgi:hypothetical protein